MNFLLRLAYKLRLIEDRVAFKSLEPLPRDILYIPEGSKVEGQIHTDLAVVIAGKMDGSVNIRGDATLTVMPTGSVNNGLVSAKLVEVSGTLRNAMIDVDRLFVHESGRVLGNSQISYGKLGKHEAAQIDGATKKRTGDRDGYIYLATGKMDAMGTQESVKSF